MAQPEPPEPVRVRVRHLQAASKGQPSLDFAIPTGSDRTVLWLKQELEGALQVPAERQRLFSGSAELHEEDTLESLRPLAGSGGGGGGASSSTAPAPPPGGGFGAAAGAVEIVMLEEVAGPLPGCFGLQFPAEAGKLGLRNLGNTCFMNAGLQCLSHIQPLAEFFLGGRYKEDVNTTSPMGHKGTFAAAFADLLRALWLGAGGSGRRGGAHDPRGLHRKCAELAPHLFEGYDQQDAQEFLAFCLDALHEDLNRVPRPPPPQSADQERRDEELAAQHGEEFAAAMAWMRYLERGRSFFVDLLQGQLRSTLTCTRCGLKASRFDPFLYLSVPVSMAMTRVTDAIEKYLEEEMLEGNERWFCERCKAKVDARKKMDLWKLPAVLVLHLKRFEFDARTGRPRKLCNALAMPRTLDLLKYTSSKQREGARYEVVSVANHVGEFGSGHYTATCRVAGAWHHFNDDRVTELPAGADPVGPQAYVIFLARCRGHASKDAAPGLVRRQSLSLPAFWPHFVSARNSMLARVVQQRYGPGEHPSTSLAVEDWPWRTGGSQRGTHAFSIEGDPASTARARRCRPCPCPLFGGLFGGQPPRPKAPLLVRRSAGGGPGAGGGRGVAQPASGFCSV